MLLTKTFHGTAQSCVLLLLEAGCNINMPTRDGFTALMCCCRNGHESCARLLVGAGADINFCKLDGESCLTLSVRGECCAAAVRLALHTMYARVFTHLPQICLLWPIEGGHQRITQMLLEAGAESGLQSVAEGEEGEEVEADMDMGHDRVQKGENHQQTRPGEPEGMGVLQEKRDALC